MAVKAAELEAELIDTVCARVRERLGEEPGGALRGLRAAVLPLGSGGGSHGP